MKTNFKIIIAIVFAFLGITLTSCDKTSSLINTEANADTTQSDTVSATIPDSVKSDLLFLREEEKLARDVYLYAYDKYGQLIFSNIAQSEQRHMDAVLGLLNEFGLPDPASPERGVFSDSTLQQLYYQLTAKVDSSLLDAMIVGCTIEDLDIHDLDIKRTRTDNTDILTVYGFLECGSRNHLRGFYSQVLLLGGTYTPQFISQEEFDEIINSEHERCGFQSK